MKTFYLASGFDNRETAREWMGEIRNGTCPLFSDRMALSWDWTEPYAKGSKSDLLASYLYLDCQRRAVEDLHGVEAADVFILLLPGGPGAHVELGMAIALKKEVYVIGTREELESSVMYSHPSVRQVVP